MPEMTAERPEPIAIVGTGCRFPGEASSASKLWDLLREPRDVSQEIPLDRFSLSRFYHPDGSHHGTTNVKRSYLLTEDVRCFDAQFFGIPPAEAEPMDPQHRLLLEVVYEALSTAGFAIEALHDSDTAVYVGLMCSDYYVLQAQDLNTVPTYNATGVANSNASSRISYCFNWHGPSMTIDTACSSSLVAVHEAVQALRSGRSRVAVAAGTNLLLSPLPYVSESKLNMLSPTGRSRMWDADADGYARGEGVAAVILKTLSSALQDGDPIECIIRETGVNQDGRTKGITMPSALAQASLIHDTYARAGLDPANPHDRCQYFEAHGTGTPAGDPQEAQALNRAFFPSARPDSDILLVGSVKTVIGHTEGTAGIAGLLKACMALKHALIPPNLLFNRLNSELEPYTRHLRVSTALQPWPPVPEGHPRRASVNSFGFGGTNAHAILESYQVPHRSTPSLDPSLALDNCEAPAILPFLFSASSEKSLIAMLQKYLSYLQVNESINLRDLAHTLATKKSVLPVRVAFAASTHDHLCETIQNWVQQVSQGNGGLVESRFSVAAPAILGIFTGQGAQWATMGSKLVRSCVRAREIIEDLDRSLASLPEQFIPRWSLIRELLASGSTSRITEAEISQPLCTAIQIMLVDLIRAAGFDFTAVVGHSSGEIAAAYAAGFVSAFDAIRIAFFRGLFARLACGKNGEPGAMMAVGTSLADARNLCGLEEFQGSLCVAAHNSADSVTLSGDMDAIEGAKKVFDEENKFARILKVDTAYHSHHMNACARQYMSALRECEIQILSPPPTAPQWFSSVRDCVMSAGDELKAQYWVDNMTQTVLFKSALEKCFQHFPHPKLNSVLEVGPHPALKGPAKEVIEASIGLVPPYSGTLQRGANDIEAFATAIGSLWTIFGNQTSNFRQLQQLCYAHDVPSCFLNDLPQYPWNHDRILWAESRRTKLFRTQEDDFHDLLGVQASDSTNEEWRWQNILKPKEISWLSGHALQGQTVFPGTGYIALAVEAASQIARGRPVQMIELLDLKILKAIAVNDTIGTELMVSMTDIATSAVDGEEIITANFATFSAIGKEASAMALNTRARIRMTMGDLATDAFPPRQSPVANLAPVDIDRFYSAMRDDLGYMYEGPFRGLTSLHRRLGHSSGTIANPPTEAGETQLLFHPGMLDNALQGLFAAYSAPGDGRLWSMRAPTACRRVTLIPQLCGRRMTPEVAFDCTGIDPRDDFITGDVDVYLSNYSQKIIEFEGLSFSPFAAATERDDRHLFQQSIDFVDRADGNLVLGDRRPTKWERQKALDAERAAFYYLKNLHSSVNSSTRSELPWYRQALLDNVERVVRLVRQGEHPYAPSHWLDDTAEEIGALMKSYGDDDPDFNLTRAVGENLPDPSVLRGETNILEYMTKNNYLDKYYTDAIGFGWLNDLISGTVEQITNRFPHMRICEIGAGTGGATGAILDRIDTAFSSYTYTDISSGFFEKAQSRLHRYHERMEYKTLNIEKDPVEQGFKEHSYDLVLAANVLHATKSLEETLRNVRRLLKPGGYLVLMEIVGNDVFRIGLVMGGLPGWWVGKDDGRRFAPTVTLEEWDGLMRRTGFSGIDTFTPMPDKIQMPGSVFVTQALDEDFRRLYEPRNFPLEHRPENDLVILSGNGDVLSSIAMTLAQMLQSHFRKIDVIRDLREAVSIPPPAYALSLMECDQPLFEKIDEHLWERFKEIVSSLSGLLWVTNGSRSNKPYAGITVGLLRSLFYEVPETKLQLLDVDDVHKVKPQLLADTFLRLYHYASMDEPSRKRLVWTLEPELLLRENRLHIVRVRPDIERNDRYNSFRRPITRSVSLDSSIVSLESADSGYILRENHTPVGCIGEDCVLVQMECSVLSSIRTPSGFFFLGLGTNLKTQEKTLYFCTENASTVAVPKPMSVPVGNVPIIDVQYMSFVVADLISQQILAMMPPAGTLLIHEPDPGLASLLSSQIAAMGRNVIFTTCIQENRRKHWIYLHGRSVDRIIRDAIPNDVTLVLDFSSRSESDRSLSSRIAQLKRPTCLKSTLSDLVLSQSSLIPTSVPQDLTRLLERASAFAARQLNSVPDGAPLEILSLKEVVTRPLSIDSMALIRWREDNLIPVNVEPITARDDLFLGNRTYWLAGLAGDMGQSLADFMIKQGARNIVLSSRTPKVCDEWVESCRSCGANVVYFSCDLTDWQSVQSVHEQITKTMPPIAGVANGSLVLRDTPIATMSYETYAAVTKPKVEGTLNLDRIFSHNTLDWFIAFSSIVGTTGNMGQAAYSAANCFMKALVNNRRSRGLAASVIDISRVLGVGFVERETRTQGKLTKEQTERLMNRTGTLAMSEPDLHQLFAEGVVAGRPGSRNSPEIITGLAPIPAEQAETVFWATNPKFAHLIHEHTTTLVEGNSTAVHIPIKLQLNEAKSPGEAAKIILESLINKLRVSLFLSPNEPLSDKTPLVDLGVDSLVGVDLRTWLLKELAIDMPVLKILGGASTSDLVDDIMEKLPQDMSKMSEATSSTSAGQGPESTSNSDSGHSTPLSHEPGSAPSEPTSIHEIETFEDKAETSVQI